MSDFLTNLVVRALAPEPAVRPRLASQFEPTPADHLDTGPMFSPDSTNEVSPPRTAGILSAEALRHHAAGSTSSARPSKASNQARKEQSDLTEPVGTDSTQSPSELISKRNGVESAPPEFKASLGGATVLSPQAPEYGDKNVSAPMAMQQRRPTGSEAGDKVREEQEASLRLPHGGATSPSPQASARGAADVAAPAVDASIWMSELEPAVSRPAKMSAPETETGQQMKARRVSPALQPLQVQPRKASGFPPRAALITKPSVAPPPPPVHITIGRVEVRAITPAPRPPAISAPRPKLGLDDYLGTRR